MKVSLSTETRNPQSFTGFKIVKDESGFKNEQKAKENECIDEIAPILHILMKLADELYFDLSENF